MSFSKVLQLCCSTSTAWQGVCRGEEVKTEEAHLSLRQGGGTEWVLAGCLACTRELLKGSPWVVVGCFPSFPGRLCEGSCCWPLFLGPWLHLSCSHTDDKNTCGAALGLAANMGENIKQNHLGLFAPVENRECFSIAGRGLRWIVPGRQEAHGETQRAQNPEGFMIVPPESVTQPTASPEMVMF